MKKFNIEINEDELNLIRLALSCAINDYRNTRVQYSAEDLIKDSIPYAFKEQENEILKLDKRLDELKKTK